MEYIIRTDDVEMWSMEKHVGVASKLLADGENMTVLWSQWEPGAIAPEHIHPHEQIGICLAGEIIFTINGEDFVIKEGEFFNIPSNTPHAERNEGDVTAVLTDFFSPKREDLLRRHFEPEIVDEK